VLYLSLVLALVVLVAAHSAARPFPHPTRRGRFFGFGAGAVVAPLLLLGSSPVVAGLFVLLIPALAAWPLVRRRVPTFLPLSAAAVLIAYGVAGWYAVDEQTAADRLRQTYPVESMADRIPAPATGKWRLPTAAVGRLDRFEQAVVRETGFPLRTYQLRRLHEGTTDAFVNSPGFGVMRMMPGPTAESLKDRSDRPETPSQPGSPSVWGQGEPFELSPPADRESLAGLHTGGLLDFVNPQGWGYVQRRDRVAGFLPHRFSKVPEAETWTVQRVELVGLLKHPEPVVYLSDRLPAMAELRDAPTRPLDAFETAGLEEVRRGDDGFAARRGDAARFVGGIRSARQCVECHGGERGDLLGAFSYTLRAKTSP
jgi:hypothetical protein